MTRRIFLSYQFRERAQADELAQVVEPANAPLDDYDQRVRIQADDAAAEEVKGRLSEMLAGADALVCLVGPTTATSSWVGWEIARAASLGKPVLAVKLEEGVLLPAALDGRHSEIDGWDPAKVRTALEQL